MSGEASDERVYVTPAGVTLGALDLIADGASRGFVVQMRAGRFHGFAVRQGNSVHGYADRCPHAQLPLSWELDDYLTPDGTLIACRWHCALFTIADGMCVGGPAMGQRLTPWPLVVVDGMLVTAAEAQP